MAQTNGRTQHTSLDGLASRVSGLEQSNAELREQVREGGEATARQIDGVSAKIDRWQENFQNRWDTQRNNKPDYTALGIAVTVLLAIGGIVYGGLTSGIARHDNSIGELTASKFPVTSALEWKADETRWLENLSNDKVSKDTLAEVIAREDQRYQIASAANLADKARIERNLEHVSETFVSKDELKESNERTDEHFKAVVSSLNELRSVLVSASPLGDAIKDLQSQIRELRAHQDIPVAPIAPIAPLAPVR